MTFISYILRFTHEKKARCKKIRTKYAFNQSEKRTRRTNDSASQWRATSGRLSAEVPRFAPLEGTIDDFKDDQEIKNTRAKSDRDVDLMKPFLQRKVELRNVEEIPPVQLNQLLSEFVFTVRNKDENYYEPMSLPWKKSSRIVQRF